MSGILVRARALCVCNTDTRCDFIVSEKEIEATGGYVLRETRKKALFAVAESILTHSASHERVAMLLTLNMEDVEEKRV